MTRNLRVFILAVLGLVSLSVSTMRADVYDARLSLIPAIPYSGQEFTLRLDIIVSPGSRVEDMRLGGMPGGGILEIGQLVEQAPDRQTGPSGQPSDLIRFQATARASQPFKTRLAPAISFNLVERRSVGFFSNVTRYSQRLRLPAVNVEIKDLPAGAPPSFNGATGHFELRAELDPQEVMPRDLITLTVRLRGDTVPDGAAPEISVPDSSLFKSYPPDTKRDADGKGLTITQTFIPLSTQAVSLAKVSFAYFDPDREEYIVAEQGPFELKFVERKADDTPSVRKITLDSATDSTKKFATAPFGQDMLMGLLPYAIGLFAALLALATLRVSHKRLALLVAAIAFLLTAAISQRVIKGRSQELRPLSSAAFLRLAPSLSATTIIELPPETFVVVLDVDGDWLRISAKGRRGWIPAAALAP